MAIPVNIEELLNKQVVESVRIEFKRDWNPEPILHAICAFANDIDNMGGGYIIVGVEEVNGVPKLPPIGLPQESIDKIQQELLQYCHKIEPLYLPVAEPVLFQEKHIFVIWVPGGNGRPYKVDKHVYLKENSEKRYYIRKMSSTVIASAEDEKSLFYVSSDIPFDDRPNLAASIDDLNIGLMREHLKDIGSSLYQRSLQMDALEIADDLQILSGPSEDVKPRNVGILMFSEQPKKYFRYAKIEIVDIPDPTGKNMTEKTFSGPIQRQLKDALLYLKNYILKEAVIKSDNKAEAERIFNYPYVAVEEILSNAVYHRSYQINEPITVRIESDFMEITSFPGFDRSISDADITNRKIRARIYRNRRIGDFLKELKLIEGRNTGFPNAFAALEANGSGYPEFIMDENRSFLSVKIPIHPYFALPDKAAKDNTYAEKILQILRKTPLTLTELSKAMGYKGITKKLTATVNAMLKNGALENFATEDKQIKLRAVN